MSRFALLILVLLVSASSVSARTIRGEVLSDSDSTAVVGATCLLKSGSKLINGVTTNLEGSFEITTSLKSALTLEVSMTGYTPARIVIEAGNNVNVGAVYLAEGVALGEVEVTANSMIDSKGRTILFPSASDVKASSTAISLFQKLPLAGMEANPITRSISVDGGSPMILINGLPSTLDDVHALQPKDISKIEYSRVTPARYANSGKKGFINITLKQRTDGGQVYMWGRSAVNTAFVDGNIRASYHQGPSQFALSYNPSWRNYQDVFDTLTGSYIGDDFKVRLEEHERSPFYYHNHNLSLKYDYIPNVRTLLSATFRVTPFYDKHSSLGSTSDTYLGNYDNDNTAKSKALSPSLDLFFKREFNEANTLELQVVGTLSSSDYRRNNVYSFADGTATAYSMDVDSRRRSLISEIHYTHEFSEKTSLSGGYQNTLSNSSNRYLTSVYQPHLTENNNYLYATLSQQIGKVYTWFSTGAQLFWIKNDVNKRHFISYPSSTGFSWNISDKCGLQASFQYSASIPSLSMLTDYAQQQTPYLISNGNPHLKTANNFRYSLMPWYRYKKFNMSLLMTFNTTEDFMMNDLSYIGNKMFLSQTINAKRQWYAGGNLNMRLNDIYGFGVNLNIGLDHYETMGHGWCRHLTSVDGSFTVWWNKDPFTISYWRKIPGKYLSGNFVKKEENGDALGFEYKPDKHWTLGVSWMYMFEKKGTKYPSWGYSPVNPYHRERYIENNANMVTLSVLYTADFGSIFRSTRRSLNNSDNGSSLLKM